MKVIEGNTVCGVYFKTIDSAKTFSNYWGAVQASSSEKGYCEIIEYTNNIEAVERAYKYTVTWYPPKDVVDSYLTLFPEEKEDFQ